MIIHRGEDIGPHSLIKWKAEEIRQMTNLQKTQRRIKKEEPLSDPFDYENWAIVQFCKEGCAKASEEYKEDLHLLTGCSLQKIFVRALPVGNSEIAIAKHVLSSFRGDYEGAEYDNLGLKFMGGKWWRYLATQGYWLEIEHELVEKRIQLCHGMAYQKGALSYFYKSIGEEGDFKIVSINQTEDYWNNTAAKYDPICRQMTILLSGEEKYIETPRPGICLKAGFLPITEKGIGKLEPHSHTNGALFQLAGDLSEEDPPRRLLDTFMSTSFLNPDEAKEAWDIIFAFIFCAVARLATVGKRGLFVQGKAGTGKSSLLEMIAEMFDDNARATAKLSDLGDEKRVFGLIGKAINIAPEEAATSWKDDAVLKSIVYGETVEARALFHMPIKAKLNCAFVSAGNKFPSIASLDPAILDRFLPIVFNVRHRGKGSDISNLGKRIAREEASAVLQEMVIAGEHMLVRGFKFPTGAATAKSKQMWLLEKNPVLIWLKNAGLEKAGSPHPCDWPKTEDAHQRYKEASTSNGVRHLLQDSFVARLAPVGIREVIYDGWPRISLQRIPAFVCRVEAFLKTSSENPKGASIGNILTKCNKGKDKIPKLQLYELEARLQELGFEPDSNGKWKLQKMVRKTSKVF